MSHSDEYSRSATLSSAALHPSAQTTSPSGGTLRAKLAPLFFAMCIIALVMAIYRQSIPPDPGNVVEQFLRAIARGDKRAAAPFLSGSERDDLIKIRPLQWELQADSANTSALSVKTTVRKVTTSRAIVDATCTREDDSFLLQFILEPDRMTGWKIRDIQQPPSPESAKKDLPESAEERELRERLIHDLSRDGKTPVETDSP